MTNALLTHSVSNYIGGQFVALRGPREATERGAVTSRNPARLEEVVYSAVAERAHLDEAINAARGALRAWAGMTLAERAGYLVKFKEAVNRHKDRLADLITDEVGKTLPEAKAEVGLLGAKVDITMEEAGAIRRITDFTVGVNATRVGNARFKPHGVMAVVGPFNFPAHLPNGHIIPALAAGNTIVFKPSDKAPAVGQALIEVFHDAGLPAGVVNLVQGGAEIAAGLVSHEEIDGILFTGSWPVGRRILEANLDRPGRIIALEMGGNNATVVMPDAHFKQAVIECVRSAFATSGQRCTCTRRIIVHEKIAERFMAAFEKATRALTVGSGRATPAPFMGPVINAGAVDAVLAFQKGLAARGAKVVVEAKRMDALGAAFVTPGILRGPAFTEAWRDFDRDCEVFGPLAQVSTCRDLADGIAQANATKYGLAAAIFTASADDAERFFREARCGCINHNTGTAGASSKLPFGGVGQSGNHRPAGAFSVDYCAYPVANMVERGEGAEIPTGMAWDDAWVK